MIEMLKTMNKIVGLLTHPFSMGFSILFECCNNSYFLLTFVIVHQIVWFVYWKICNDSDHCMVPVILSSIFVIVSSTWSAMVTSLSKRVHPSDSPFFGRIDGKFKKNTRKMCIFVSSGLMQVAFVVSNLIFIKCSCQRGNSMNNYNSYLRLQTIFIFIFAFGLLPFSLKILEIITCSLMFELRLNTHCDQACYSEHNKCSYKFPRTLNVVIFHLFSIIFISYILFAIITPFYNKTAKAVVEYAKLTTYLNKQKHQGLELIHSLVPPKLAAEVMKSSRRDFTASPTNSAFRDFYVAKMDEVSILFADIVGFTKMSSSKTAESVVDILNDLFGRFDVICSESGCEKIGTLGDCYYCVSGCPQPRSDHAKCCVTMGLLVCRAIVQFDEDRNEEVDMRVGVHSGSVLCGLVGTRRFKFDVWSHDVTLANEMESSGKPGRVHVTDATHQLVSNIFQAEPGPDHPDMRGNKILVEEYNVETQKYIIRHEEESNYIKTWFIVDDLDKNKQTINIKRSGDINRSIVQMFKNVEVKIKDEDFKMDGHTICKYFLKLKNSKIKKNEDDCLRMENKLEVDSTVDVMRIGCKICLLLFLLFQLIAASIENDKRRVTIALSILYFVSILVATIMIALKLSSISQNTFRCISHLKNIIHKRTSLLDNVYYIYLLSLTVIIPMSFFFVSGSYYSNGDLVLQLIVVEMFPFLMWKTSVILRLMLYIPVTMAVILLILYSDINSISFNTCQSNDSMNSSNKSINESIFTEGNESISTIYVEYDICLIIELVLALTLGLVLTSIINFSIDTIKKIHSTAVISVSDATREYSESKEKEEWLLNNIVPVYVLKVLKQEGKYCRTINNVGIIFAKVTNFDSFYDESFQGGIEFLRILNELISDFEELFSEDRFCDIEKIKTIGSCLMAASGLNLEEIGTNETPEHLYALIDFCVALLIKLSLFNANMLSFEFIMTIGYNIGQVTCGVVGLSKLLFDIWGDAINVASRMYSTGVYGRVQLPENSYLMLKNKFNFEYRGDIFVKGKGDMRTYLLVNKII